MHICNNVVLNEKISLGKSTERRTTKPHCFQLPDQQEDTKTKEKEKGEREREREGHCNSTKPPQDI